MENKTKSEALNKIEQYRRNVLQDLLEKCTEKQQKFFEKMYGTRKAEDLSTDKIDNAIDQCERTIKKNEANANKTREELCEEEREAGNGPCGGCITCCHDLLNNRDELKKDFETKIEKLQSVIDQLWSCPDIRLDYEALTAADCDKDSVQYREALIALESVKKNDFTLVLEKLETYLDQAEKQELTIGYSENYHDIHCEADSIKPVGSEKCSCKAGKEIKRLRSALISAKKDIKRIEQENK